MKLKRYSLCTHYTQFFGASLLLVLLAVAVILWPHDSVGQQSAVPKLTLIQVEELVVHHVPDSTMSTQIQRRGLAFTPNPAIIESLRGKGAGPLTLEAIEGLFPNPTRSALIVKAQPSAPALAMVIDPPSNVRASPSAVSPIVCSVTSKASIRILGSEGNWYKTDICGGKLGFIYRNQIKF